MNTINTIAINMIKEMRNGDTILDNLAKRFVIDSNVHTISFKWYDMDDYAYGTIVRKIHGKYFVTKWQHEYRGSDLVITQSTRCVSSEKAITRIINSLDLYGAMIRVTSKDGKPVKWDLIFPVVDYGTLPKYFQKVKKFIPSVLANNAEKRASLLAKMRKLPEPPQEIEV